MANDFARAAEQVIALNPDIMAWLDTLPQAPPLMITGLGVIPGLRHDGRCPMCCHWSLPLAIEPARDGMGGVVGLRFQGWIVWHLHVLIHQRAEGLPS